MIAWTSPRPEGDGYSVFARGFDPHNEPLATEFRVDEDKDKKNTDATQVAPAGENRFLFVWRQMRKINPPNEDIFAQGRNAHGNLIGDRSLVSAEAGGLKQRPFLAKCPPGDAVIAWSTGNEIYVQQISASGELAGRKIPVSTAPRG